VQLRPALGPGFQSLDPQKVKHRHCTALFPLFSPRWCGPEERELEHAAPLAAGPGAG